MKQAGICLMLILLILLLSGCGFLDNDVSKERIVAYVTENQDKLSAYVRDMLEDAAGQEALFRERFGRRTIVKSVYLYQDGILDRKGTTMELRPRNKQASVPFCMRADRMPPACSTKSG